MKITVAVAPYWNVNAVDYKFQLGLCLVAVAPYWNVNDKEIEESLDFIFGSSSTILECKCVECLHYSSPISR